LGKGTGPRAKHQKIASGGAEATSYLRRGEELGRKRIGSGGGGWGEVGESHTFSRGLTKLLLGVRISTLRVLRRIGKQREIKNNTKREKK